MEQMGRRRTPIEVALVILVAAWGSSARADLHFAQPTADIGEVHTGKPLTHRFTFVNAGPEVVEITDARAGCGCLTPRLDRRVFQPGEEGSLLLEVHTLSQTAGPHTWRVQVSYRAGERQAEVPLQLMGRVVAEVSVQPATLTIFAGQATVVHELLLTDIRPKPLAVVDVRTSSPKLTARMSGEEKNAAGQIVRKVRLEVAAECPDGRHSEQVVLQTDDPDYRELKVPVTIIQQSRRQVAASPSQLTFQASRGQPVAAQLVQVRDHDDRPVVVDKVTADHPAVVCQWAQGPGHRATVRIRVDPARLEEDALHTLIQIQVTKPVQETLVIPVHVAVRAAQGDARPGRSSGHGVAFRAIFLPSRRTPNSIGSPFLRPVISAM